MYLIQISLAQSILVYFISPIISLLIFLIFANVIMSWLVSFGVVNLRNPAMQQIYYALEAVTRPIMEPIRRILPPLGGLDFSPIIAFFLLSWINSYVIRQVLYPMLG